MTQTTEPTAPIDTVAAKHEIHKIMGLLSLIKAGAWAIDKGELSDDQGPAAGIYEVAEEARAQLYELMDTLGLDKEPVQRP